MTLDVVVCVFSQGINMFCIIYIYIYLYTSHREGKAYIYICIDPKTECLG